MRGNYSDKTPRGRERIDRSSTKTYAEPRDYVVLGNIDHELLERLKRHRDAVRNPIHNNRLLGPSRPYKKKK